MNPAKKVLVNFAKPRGIYEPHNMVYNRKYNPSEKKERMRIERRLNKINRFDDEETGEPPIEALTPNKAKLVFRMMTEFHNSHRLSRKEIPLEEKKEFIKKCKEFSLYGSQEWRLQFNEMTKVLRNEEEMLRSACLMPMPLVEEVLDPEGLMEEGEQNGQTNEDDEEISDEEDHYDNRERAYEITTEKEEKFIENNENIEALEYTPEYLYLPQVLRIFPDDYHIIFKTLINLPAYESQKQGGVDQGGESVMSGGPDESQ